ncbi:PTS sugar transporter subunit IIA [Zavarzinella formosa]|uniref:PTS sugar transporter subunit IIA n=1 Tax=Zavarzinella formosa TaxID=360055 RepID=UPI00031C9487|nr:PTS sugar transporter subunit IIA [Zavarzinella formosa]
MKNFLIREALVPSLVATTKEEAIRELVASLQSAGYFKPAEMPVVVGEIMRREGLGSTGIGRTVAIPHSRFEGLPRLIGTLGLSRAGIPFQSIDGNDVHLIFLLVSRPDQPGPHLHALETIVRISESDEFLAAMRACETKEAMWNLILETPDPWSQDDG